MLNEELPRWLDWGITLIAVASFFFFLWFMKPMIMHKEWKEKFYDNKVAWTLIILSIIVFLLMFAMGAWVDTYFGVETYK
ncbi:MAG TPA: hypothetical protein EYP05_02425 [Piscirickettsiaceae bacterium]|nr:hypothetical protein [Piscirickettsiaceae bacterium]